jgi:hypothetical protein
MGLASEHVGYMQYAHAHVSVRPALKHYALHLIASHSWNHALDMLGMLILKLVYISYCKFVVV